jgi:Ca2+-binding EF-hand superfamily protein
MKLSRTALGVCLCLLVSAMLAGTADAQHKGGRRGGHARMGSHARGGGRRMRKKDKAEKAVDPGPAVTAPQGLTQEQLDQEARFEKLIDAIDAKLAAADEAPAGADSDPSAPFELPVGIVPGSPLWADLELPIFEACDTDRSGWISYREAHAALELDRDDFAVYDRDHDGRIGSREFNLRYEDVVSQTGVFRLPKLSTGRGSIPRAPRQLTTAFDSNGDTALDQAEVEALLREYGRKELSPSDVVARLDRDGSGKLDGPEIQQLSRLIAADFVMPLDDAPRTISPDKVDELFGTLVSREGVLNETSLPPRIDGPVTHFRRLDLDGDGYVTIAELNKLQSPLQLSARVSTTLAALDTDEDGKLSRAEFLNALRVARQP